MDKPVPDGLKNTFLVHAVVCLVLGLPFLLAPDLFASVLGFATAEPVSALGLDAALLALGVSSWLALIEPIWQRVAIVLKMEIAYTILGGLALLYELLVVGAPPSTWFFFIVIAIFAALWLLYYFSEAPAEAKKWV